MNPERAAAVGSPREVAARLDLAVRIAREAGELTLRYYQAAVAVERKADASPVTIADREAERLLRERIAAAFPGDGILGEEFGEQPGTSGFRWILDPIDGTKSFITGVPLYGTLIGVEFAPVDSTVSAEPQCLLGVIEIPALQERVWAAIGQGAWYGRGRDEPVPARVSQVPQLAEATFLTSEVASFAKRNRADAYVRLEAACRVTRTWGDCYGYLLVATGRADVMVDPLMNVWDAAALLPIITEAGGRFTDWTGRPTIHSGDAVATNGRLHDAALAVTKR